MPDVREMTTETRLKLQVMCQFCRYGGKTWAEEPCFSCQPQVNDLPSRFERQATPQIAEPAYPHEAYCRLLDRTFETIKSLAHSKGDEYAHGGDRLDNFRRNGKDTGLPMESIWRVYAAKHWDAITTYVRDLQEGRSRTRSEPISGRALDLMVYLTLFLAMVEEREG